MSIRVEPNLSSLIFNKYVATAKVHEIYLPTSISQSNVKSSSKSDE